MTDDGWALRLRRSAPGRWLIELAHRLGVPGAVVLVVLAAGVVVAFATFGFAVALDDVMERNGIVGADPGVQRFLVQHRSPELDDVFRFVTRLGSPAVIISVAVVAVALLVWRRHRVLAMGLVLAAVGTAVLVAVVKALVDRQRPPPIDRVTAATGSSFPSGHSAEAIAFYGALAWIVVVLVAGRRARVAACVGALGLGLLVGFSRAYLGVHWASDVMSGWLVGLAWLATTIAICSLLPVLRSEAQP